MTNPREIKFRVWDFNEKAWVADGAPMDLNFSLKNNTILFDNDYYDLGKNLALCQYTGLKDKNGKEIYEGDIVRLMEQDWIEGDGEWVPITSDRVEYPVDVVVIRPPRFWLEHESFGYEREDLVDPETCEVIGNLYENPELLKEEKDA